jgi:hypothetical protein
MDADFDDVVIKMEWEGTDVFVVANGMKIARRGHKGTQQAKTWISLEPGWRVFDGPHATIAVEYAPPRIQ